MKPNPRSSPLGPVTLFFLVSALAIAGAGTIHGADSPDTAPSSAGSPAPAINHVAINGPGPLFTEMVQAQAKAAGDREVAAAAEYNLVHLQALAADEAIARPALEQLAKSGDAFPLQWLEAPGHLEIPAARQPLISATQERIRERLKGASPLPEKQVDAWLLRAAVSDLTCNALQVPLKRFSREWLARHGSDHAVGHQLDQLTKPGERTEPIHDPSWIRARAASYSILQSR